MRPDTRLSLLICPILLNSIPPASAATLHVPADYQGATFATGCEAIDLEYDADLDHRDLAVWQNLFGQ